MKIEFVKKNNFEITEGIKEHVEAKLERISKLFSDNQEIRVTLWIEKLDQVCEIIITHNGHTYKAEESQNDLYRAINETVEKIYAQCLKEKDKHEFRH